MLVAKRLAGGGGAVADRLEPPDIPADPDFVGHERDRADADIARLDPARDYYVRVTTRARPVGGSFLGLTKTITSRARFTFIP